VRAVAGRTFIYKSGGWIDSEAVSGTKKSLKVKYLSDAYFALVKAKPELKAAFALGGRLVVVIAKDTSVIIDPAEGETSVEKVTAFIK
jgi:Ca-activated chloride channel family protein